MVAAQALHPAALAVAGTATALTALWWVLPPRRKGSRSLPA